MKQAIKIIHVSDIHFGSGEGHGRLNPKTGLNVRFEDFSRSFARVVDYALSHQADMFLFSGDAYKNASPEPLYQKAFAEQLKKLSDAKIPTVLLVGNHDQILKATASHSMSVFQSLEVPGVTVIESPKLIRIETKNGPLQLIGLPHVTRHLLMSHEKYGKLGAGEIDQVLVKHVSEIMQHFYEQLDEQLPSVATAHIMVDTARAGAEQDLLVGYSMTFPLDIFVHPKLDYVALGHVHKHQVLRAEKPAVAYAGSIERVDFGEESEDKGFIEADIRRGEANLNFHSLGPRPFVTVKADLTDVESPTQHLLDLARKQVESGAVFRIKYRIQQSRLHELDEEAVRNALPEVLSLRFKPEIIFTERPRRMPEINESLVLSPISALDKYLSQVAPENKTNLLAKAQDLISQLNKGSTPSPEEEQATS
ncbi:MAG: exonuclease SbcCD subunit D [Candidatus Obscuribacterales bacterium]|jgi:exonuclease SbcD|nr:exonuclease SbcCD subunit D [Candidatus Obscuribacterales bacterium]